MKSVLIVGAGMAGLTLARALNRNGIPCDLVDKGRSVGGRLATRRKGSALLDHGAPQYQPPLQTHDFWTTHRAVKNITSQGRGPFFGVDGMNRLAKLLWEDLEKSSRAGVSLILEAHLKRLELDSKESYRAQFLNPVGELALPYSEVVFTCPLGQWIEILENSSVPFDRHALAAAKSIHYDRQLVGLLWGDQWQWDPQQQEALESLGVLESVSHADRQVSVSPAMSFYFSPQKSAELWGSEDSDIRNLLRGALRLRPDFQDLEIKRWRYAQVANPSQEAYFRLGPGLWYCGDACAHRVSEPSISRSGIQRAERSALALAAELVKKLRNC